MGFDNSHIHHQQQANRMVSAVRPKVMYLLSTILLFLTYTPLSAVAQQNHFATPEAAGNKLYYVVETMDTSSVKDLLGAENLFLLPLDEIDTQERELFIRSWKASHRLIAGIKDEVFIEVGLRGWTFPIPLRNSKDGWYFDPIAGAEIVQTRRIGRNELSTIQAALAYYDAQKEYSEQDRNANGVLEYAQKFISTPGKKDGLYWDVEAGETPSPLGSLFDAATPGGAYHGYYYKILKQQDETARGGAYSYLRGDRMRYGFALLAWPAEYGDTGIMSFLINHDGLLFEKNLGPETDQLVAEMNSYEPGNGWFLVHPEEIFW